jgi:hypothetical protein
MTYELTDLWRVTETQLLCATRLTSTGFRCSSRSEFALTETRPHDLSQMLDGWMIPSLMLNQAERPGDHKMKKQCALGFDKGKRRGIRVCQPNRRPSTASLQRDQGCEIGSSELRQRG